MKLWTLPLIEGSILKYTVPPLWPNNMDERRTTFAKAYGIKLSCYWELFGEHVRNLGTLEYHDFLPGLIPLPKNIVPILFRINWLGGASQV
jgi:hypothetical protein